MLPLLKMKKVILEMSLFFFSYIILCKVNQKHRTVECLIVESVRLNLVCSVVIQSNSRMSCSLLAL